MGQVVAKCGGSIFALGIGIAAIVTIAAPLSASAADKPLPPPMPAAAAPVPELGYFAPQPVPAFQVDFAARWWFGTSKSAKRSSDAPSVSNNMISRLTYNNLNVNAGELFGRVAFTNGWFIKGYFGTGSIANGSLQDEDFPPGITPYSSTTSAQHDGFLNYASIDAGFNILRGGDFRVGAFVGYHYFNEMVNAYGCTQLATNPDICNPTIPTTVLAITQNNRWQSLRLGLDGTVLIGDRLKLSAEAAWLPYVRLDGTDLHWLRIGTDPGDFTGPIPEDGKGSGYQFEAQVSYLVKQDVSVGFGARYWHMQANGNTHEAFVDGGCWLLPVDWKTDVFGVFAQASIKLGPYPIGLH